MRRLIFGIIILGLAAIAAAVYYFEGRTVLRIAIPRDSDDQAIMAAAALDFAENRESIRLKLVAVENLAESSRALEEGHADLAIVRSDIAMPPSGQTVLIMRRNAAVLFAPAQSGLRTIGDLRGHKVGILQTMPTGKLDNQFLLDTALAQYDVPPASVRRVFLTVAELARAIEHKEIDGGSRRRRGRLGRFNRGGQQGCRGRPWSAGLSSHRRGTGDRATLAPFRGR
jgi:ABC-type nitrate/sulfonate/bicarbonate transport system substrate-binding protein